LRRPTYIYVGQNIAVMFRKHTKVAVVDGVLTFNPIEDVKVVRIQRFYFIHIGREVYPIIFPKGGGVPYPLSML
jgi:hypothetical protein